jgi:serine/threonine protein phosphatase 1
VTKISRVQRCQRLPCNTRGRDLVVGDLHGHRSLLEVELDRLGFDPGRDRVLSVGDLVDRGPESLATLALIEEPWFHAVLGNHELMLLAFLGRYTSRQYARKAYPTGGGEWIGEALARHRPLVMRLAERVASLPVAIHVEGDVPFNVTHGDLDPVGSRQDYLFGDETVCVHKAEAMTSSRQNIGEASRSALLGLQFGPRAVRISATPLGALPITYVGHSPLQQVTVHNSYVYIDQRAGVRGPKRAADTAPTVLDHRRFAYWLGGVATARGVPGAASARRRDGGGVAAAAAALA